MEVSKTLFNNMASTLFQQASKDGVFKRPDYTEDEIKKKREEAERRARRGEMDVMQEHTFATIAMLSGLSRVRVLQAIFDVGFLNVTHSICRLPCRTQSSLKNWISFTRVTVLGRWCSTSRFEAKSFFPKDDQSLSPRRRRRTERTLQG